VLLAEDAPAPAILRGLDMRLLVVSDMAGGGGVNKDRAAPGAAP